MTEAWKDALTATGLALVAALAIIVAAQLGMRLAARRWPLAAHLHRSVRIPFRVLVLVAALNPLIEVLRPEEGEGWGWVSHPATVALIIAVGWLITAVALFLLELSMRRYRIDVPDNRDARRAKTQTMVLRRLAVIAGVVITLGAVLLTFPGVRTIGASLLASAGLISVIAAVAAQSTLANLFAGVQLTFSDAIRIDDVVIVDDEWGRVEEITLSYVVVRSWDDRRLVLPCTYFTANPFQNWTREGSALLGTVELDLDWRVDTDALRAQVDLVLADTDLWDGRQKLVQVTDAIGGWVRVRVLLSALDAGRLFDLRCLVREHLVGWVRTDTDAGLPRQRVQLVEP